MSVAGSITSPILRAPEGRPVSGLPRPAGERPLAAVALAAATQRRRIQRDAEARPGRHGDPAAMPGERPLRGDVVGVPAQQRLARLAHVADGGRQLQVRGAADARLAAVEAEADVEALAGADELDGAADA